jgi:hypothetical protein
MNITHILKEFVKIVIITKKVGIQLTGLLMELKIKISIEITNYFT